MLDDILLFSMIIKSYKQKILQKKCLFHLGHFKSQWDLNENQKIR